MDVREDQAVLEDRAGLNGFENGFSWLAATVQQKPEIDGNVPREPRKPGMDRITSSVTGPPCQPPTPQKATSENCPNQRSTNEHINVTERFHASQEFQELISQITNQHDQDLSVLHSEVMALRHENQTLRQTEVAQSPGSLHSNLVCGANRSRPSKASSGSVCSGMGIRTQSKESSPYLNAAEIVEALTAQESLVGNPAHAMAMVDYGTAEFEGDSSKPLGRFQRFQVFLQSNTFEMIIATLLCSNVLLMAVELQFLGLTTGHKLSLYNSGPSEEEQQFANRVFRYADLLFTALFLIDVVVRAICLKMQFWKSVMNYIDVAAVTTSIMELFQEVFPFSPMLFRLVRVGKLARALRMVTMSNNLSALQLLTKCIQGSVHMLFWSFCLLTFIQCIAGMIISHLVREYLEDSNADLEVRREVFMYYGTFTRVFLSMFEILFANWGPPCRALMESVSESFSVFFLLYRCVLGFAVLNVLNAVFVQKSLAIASHDEELAFKQKRENEIMYARKVKKLFKSIDTSGDGAITFHEFSKLVNSPKLKFWMSQLELEYHDLLSLFEFLDDGDGEITLNEFIEGAARLKGGAKAIDVWRLETKIELLFEQVMPSQATPDLQDVFDSSGWSHIHTIRKSRSSPLAVI